jgi:tetratricopeptide (TPR) repeat protein
MSVMHKSIIVLLVSFVTFLFSINAVAKTAAEVFEKTSQSVVVVKIQDEKGNDIALGSGIVLPGGDVATNCHVIDNAVGIKVYQGKKGYNAIPRYLDYDRDVCSLSVPDMKAPSVSVGSTKTLKVGSRVYAIGAPKGLTLTLSEGIISNLRTVEGGQYLQITAPISHGSSGGGLFDEDGRLIGLTTFYIAEGQQLNFAIPVEWIGELSQHHNKNLKTADTYEAWLNQTIALEEKKDWNGLINHALKRIKAFPQDALAWYALGLAYGESGQTAKAIEAYNQVIRINPEYREAWYNLGVEYGESGQPAKEIEAYQQAIRINPEYANAWCNLGATYGKSGQPAKAIEALQHAIRINPEDALIWYNLGRVYSRLDQPAKAIEAYQQALRINPDNADAWRNLGATYGELDQIAKAVEALQQALRINPEYAAAWYDLGFAYHVLGQTGQVNEVYKRLKAIDPTKAAEFFNKVILP